MLDDTYQLAYVIIIVSSFGQTIRARCALNKEILDLLNEESISGVCSMVELVYILDEKPTMSV